MSDSTTNASPSSRTRWHLLLGAVLDLLLRPVGIDVFTEFPVMQTPPKADILLLRRERPLWSPEQMARLPDGIRDSQASHILIEFKYTESLNEQALRQAVGYDYFYQQARELKEQELQTVLVSAKTPRKSTLDALGYTVTAHAGVFRSPLWVIRKILLLSLNDLDDTAYNAPIKCFASRQRERLAAFITLKGQQRSSFSDRFWRMVNGLWNLWFFRGGDTMTVTLTPEEVTEMGKMWGEHFLSGLSVEERLAGLKSEDILRNFKPEDILRNFKPEDILRNFKPEDIEQYLRKLKECPPDDDSTQK